MTTTPLRRAAILLAKALITGAAERVLAANPERFTAVPHAFSEQGSPSLRAALDQFAAQGMAEIHIVSHLLAGEVVADLAYAPLPGKQTLR